MTADTPKIARSTRSQDLLCRLVREIDYAEAYRVIRCLAPTSSEELPATTDVIVWVIDLMRLRDAVLAGDSGDAIRELAEKCGKPIDDDDDSPMDVSNAALEYLEHSTELQRVWDILSGEPERAPCPYPLDMTRGLVASRAAQLVADMNAMADRLGEQREESPALGAGWQRTQRQTEVHNQWVTWRNVESGVRISFGLDAVGLMLDTLDVSRSCPVSELAAVLCAEQQRLVVS